MIIAIDGTSGSGKSTIAKELSRSLRLELLNTGLLYRKLTQYCLQNNIDFNDEENVVNAVLKTDFSDINKENLHTEIISTNVPYYSKLPGVRAEIRKYQRNYAEGKSIIVEGRDIGTIVFPEADYKIYITASLEERARRRIKELGNGYKIEEIMETLKKRDDQDSHRSTSPLRISENAKVIDTTSLSINEVVKKVISIIYNGDA